MRRHRHHRSLEGTEAPPRGLFVDRFGTLIDRRAACLEPDGGPLRFVPKAVDALFRARERGWNVYLIGNEAGVAEGRVSDEHWLALERELLAELASQGVSVTRNYACLDHPHGKGAHRRPSVFLLPDTGIFFHALHNDGIVLEQSWVVGDGTLELAAGERAGLRTAGVRTGLGLEDRELHVDPTFLGVDLAECVDTLLGPRLMQR